MAPSLERCPQKNNFHKIKCGGSTTCTSAQSFTLPSGEHFFHGKAPQLLGIEAIYGEKLRLVTLILVYIDVHC